MVEEGESGMEYYMGRTNYKHGWLKRRHIGDVEVVLAGVSGGDRKNWLHMCFIR